MLYLVGRNHGEREEFGYLSFSILRILVFHSRSFQFPFAGTFQWSYYMIEREDAKADVFKQSCL